MDKPTILSETFEQLKQIPTKTAGQAIGLPGDLASKAIAQVTGVKVKTDPLTGIEIPQRGKIKKLQKQEKKQKAAAIPYAQQIISASAKKVTAESIGQMPVYITGQAGFDKDKTIRRMQGMETEKPKLPPPVSASKPKWGTSERKGGVSG